MVRVMSALVESSIDCSVFCRDTYDPNAAKTKIYIQIVNNVTLCIRMHVHVFRSSIMFLLFLF